jgi:hypothetical protein
VSLDKLTLDDFTEDDFAALGDEGRALAENIARNLTESVRQSRNALDAAVNARKTLSDVADATDLQLAPQNLRNLEASFSTHLKAMFRQAADNLGRSLKAQKFMVLTESAPLGGKTTDAELIGLQQYADENHANLGPHPHSTKSAVPIPPGYEDVAPDAARLVNLTPAQRAVAIAALATGAASSGSAGTPPPEPPKTAASPGDDNDERPAEVTEQLRKVEAEIADKPVEHMRAIDAKGNVLFSVIQKPGTSKLTLRKADLPKLRNAYVTHNHPSGGAFSFDDFKTMIEHDVAELRIVTPEHEYSLRPDRKAKPNVKALKSMFDAETEKAENDALDMILGGASIRKANIDATHQIWERLAKQPEFGVIYSRRSRK